MKTKYRKSGGSLRCGSALILVVVVTVLLAVIGVMFLMVSRVGDMLGSAARQDFLLDQAVETVTDRIELVLMQDLFGSDLTSGLCDGKGRTNECCDVSGMADPWLASLEPVWHGDNGTPNDPEDDLYQWPFLSNLWSSSPNFEDRFWDRILRDAVWPSNQDKEWGAIVPEYPDLKQDYFMAPADADGDGVADSMWVPAGNASNGETIYAAVRIIDNCAMLNLNTAHGSRLSSSWNGQGWWLSEVDYGAFLRGDDRTVPDVVRKARLAVPIPSASDASFEEYHRNVILHIEDPYGAVVREWEKQGSPGPKPQPVYCLFDIQDEVEIRNRFLLTSLAQARFEQPIKLSAPYRYGMYETFDYERGEFEGGWNVPLRVKRIPVTSTDELRVWKQRMNPKNFDNSDPANSHSYYYDRRHVCTFYSFDRNLRRGGDPAMEGLSEEELRQVYKKIFMPADGHAVSVRADFLSNTPEARRHILHLLYAFRAYYLYKGESLSSAARKAAQITANMIDYLDDDSESTKGPFFDSWTDPDTGKQTLGQTNNNPTFFNRSVLKRLILEVSTALHTEDSSVPIVNIDNIDPSVFKRFDFGLADGETIYGFERQPFLSELYVVRNNNNVPTEAALELINPYDTSISLSGWQIVFHGARRPPFRIPAGKTIPAGTADHPGRFVIRSTSSAPVDITFPDFGMGTLLTDANSIELQRPCPDNPAVFLTVDQITREQIELVLTDNAADGLPTLHVLKRQDTGWKFTNATAYVHQKVVPPAASPATLGSANGITVEKAGWQMPVADYNPISADRGLFTLGDFEKVLFVGNQRGSDSKCVTMAVAEAEEEGDIRFDIEQEPELLGFVCFLNREKGSLPGRININTAPKHVLAAAIPSVLTHSTGTTNLVDPDTETAQVAEDYAELIIQKRPFAHLGELLTKIPEFEVYAKEEGLDVVGDKAIKGDLEERDLILSHLSNIFTTRSDVFTAYMLVRVGRNGPQRRVIAIFDRSQVWSPTDRPEVVAMKIVPNPR